MLALVWKDLLVELRTRETFASLLLLGALLLLVLSFAFDPLHPMHESAAPGVLWVAIIFSASTGISRSLLRERENNCFDAMLLAPIDRGTIFLAKTVANFLLLSAAQVFLVPLFIILFNLDFGATLGCLALLLPATTLGFAAIGTLFAAVSLRTRAREVLQPLLMLPLATPLFLAAVEVTAATMEGASFASQSHWLNLIAAFDVLFLALGWMTFEHAVVD